MDEPNQQQQQQQQQHQQHQQHHHSERTKPLSWVWAYFKPTDIGGVRYNVCHAPIAPGSNELCLKRMIPDKSGGTKSMGNHLERKHRLSKSDPPPLSPITVSLGPPSAISTGGLGSSKRRLNRETLMAGIARFFICSNLPPQTIDDQQFIELLHLCNPLITRSLLFKPHTLTQFIHQKFIIAKQSLKDRLAKISSPKLSFSSSRSTPADRNHSTIALVVHWVSDQATLRSIPLGLVQLNRRPSSRNIAQAILTILTDYDLQERIFSLTIDNVPDLIEFGEILATLIPGFKPESQLIGCLGSLINRSAELVLRDLFPPNSDDSSVHHHSTTSAVIPGPVSNPTASQGVQPSTIISRLQNLTLHLRQSAQKSESFNRIVGAVTNDSQAGLLITQSHSRWNSTYQVLTRAYQVKEAIQIFCLKEVGFAQFLILDQEWDIVRQICDFLKPMNTAANEISSDKPCDMITATPTFCWLLRRLNKVRRNYEGRELLEPIKEMLDRLSAYQENTQNKAVHIFAMILDPRIKMSNFEDNNNSGRIHSRIVSIGEIQKAFYESSRPYSLYPIYRNPCQSGNDVIVDPSPVAHSTENLEIDHHHHHHHLSKRTRPSHDDHHQHPTDSDSDSDYSSGKPRIFKKKPKLMIGLKDEIANYLEVECEDSTCVPLEYWKANASKFPSLSQMSKDFLAVQASCGLAFGTCERFDQLAEGFLAGPIRDLCVDPTDPNSTSTSQLQDSPGSSTPHFGSAPGLLPPPRPSPPSSTPANLSNQTNFAIPSLPSNHTRPPSSSSSSSTPLESIGFRIPSAFQNHLLHSTVEKDILVSAHPSSSNTRPTLPPSSIPNHHLHPPDSTNTSSQEIDPSLIAHPSPASSVLDSLDAFGLINRNLLACHHIVCLFFWAFSDNLVDL